MLYQERSQEEELPTAKMSWFRAAIKPAAPMIAAEEDARLQDAESGLLQLLNDDVAEADAILNKKTSSFHYLGVGVSSFIASMLGAEKELLKEAAARLQEAETKTWEDMKRAEKEPGAFRSDIYAPGTEYLLCYCSM